MCTFRNYSLTGQHVVLVTATNRHENKQIKNSFWSLMQLMRVYRGFVFEAVAHLPTLWLLTLWTMTFTLAGMTCVAFIISLKWRFMVFNLHTSVPHTSLVRRLHILNPVLSFHTQLLIDTMFSTHNSTTAVFWSNYSLHLSFQVYMTHCVTKYKKD